MGSPQARGLAEADRLIHSCGHTHMLKMENRNLNLILVFGFSPPRPPSFCIFATHTGPLTCSHILASTPCGNPLSGLITHAETHRPGYSCILVIVPLFMRKPTDREHIFLSILLPRILAKTLCGNPSGQFTHAETHCPGLITHSCPDCALLFRGNPHGLSLISLTAET